MLSFLAEVSAGTPHNNAIIALSKRAMELQQAMRRDSPNHLDISATATRYFDQKRRGEHVAVEYHPKFEMNLRFSQPSLVSSCELTCSIGPRLLERSLSYKDGVDWTLLFKREGIQENMKILIENEIAVLDAKPSGKMADRVDVSMTVYLEDYIEWAEESERYVLDQYDVKAAKVMKMGRLVWPDVEVNPEMHWELPISHVQQASRVLFAPEKTEPALVGRKVSEQAPSSQEDASKNKPFRRILGSKG
jgi:hypothetical protein